MGFIEKLVKQAELNRWSQNASISELKEAYETRKNQLGESCCDEQEITAELYILNEEINKRII